MPHRPRIWTCSAAATPFSGPGYVQKMTRCGCRSCQLAVGPGRPLATATDLNHLQHGSGLLAIATEMAALELAAHP